MGFNYPVSFVPGARAVLRFPALAAPRDSAAAESGGESASCPESSPEKKGGDGWQQVKTKRRGKKLDMGSGLRASE